MKKGELVKIVAAAVDTTMAGMKDSGARGWAWECIGPVVAVLVKEALVDGNVREALLEQPK